VTDFWDGAPPLVEASRRLSGVARGAQRDAGAALVGAAAAELLMGRAERAEELGRRALSLAPQLASAPTLMAYVAAERGDARAHAAAARAALELHPGFPSALAIQARSLEAAGKRLEAQGSWKEALDAAPDLVTGRIALARLLALDGQRPQARAVLEPLVKENPGATEAVGTLRELSRPGSGGR
jgi:tetratricopeptide (TPR) repeat protein